MNPLDELKSVLCDPDGKCCIAGSDGDRAVIDAALQRLSQELAACELTDDEILDIGPRQDDAAWPWDSQIYFARSVIAAHEVKKGVSQ